MGWQESALALGKALAASPEFTALVSAEKAYADDKGAQELVKAAQDAGAKLAEWQKLGKKVDVAEAKRIAAIQMKLDACVVVQKLVASQKAYDALVQEVNRKVLSVVEEQRKK